MCHMHYVLASNKIIGVTDPPTKERVAEVLKEADLDSSGYLTEDEFVAFSAQWFQKQGPAFLGRVALSSFMGFVALPNAAVAVQDALPLLRPVPKFIFKMLFGMSTFTATHTLLTKYPLHVLASVRAIMRT